jgi:hypothetical protein
MAVLRRSIASTLAILTTLTAACHDAAVTPLTAPTPQDGANPAAICSMNVRERTLSCASTIPSAGSKSSASGGAVFDRILGGQDIYIRLASSGTSYDGGTQILSTNVTVQNLTRSLMGTTDGASMTPISVFFSQQPTVTGGTGAVTIANADSVGTFTGSGQSSFQYPQMLRSYEISSAHRWEFNVPVTVTSFKFFVYVSAPVVNETATLLDLVWQGLADASWTSVGNWVGGAAPSATSTVVIPADSTLDPTASQPVLATSSTIDNLRVGYGSSLGLGGFTLSVTGNVDAIGPISGGTTELSGGSALLGGTLDALVVKGSTSLQRSTTATGAVSVTDGSLTVSAFPLSIQIP